jgi:hypothetical protein
MSNIGKQIKDFYCNGCFGRDYDLEGARIESEGFDWIVIRKENGEPDFASFSSEQEKQESVNQWT